MRLVVFVALCLRLFVSYLISRPHWWFPLQLIWPRRAFKVALQPKRPCFSWRFGAWLRPAAVNSGAGLGGLRAGGGFRLRYGLCLRSSLDILVSVRRGKQRSKEAALRCAVSMCSNSYLKLRGGSAPPPNDGNEPGGVCRAGNNPSWKRKPSLSPEGQSLPVKRPQRFISNIWGGENPLYSPQTEKSLNKVY